LGTRRAFVSQIPFRLSTMPRFVVAFLCLTGFALAARRVRMQDDVAARAEEDVAAQAEGAKDRVSHEAALAEVEGRAALKGIRHDGRYFVFLEVYELQGSRSWESSKMASDAARGVNVAGLTQITEGANATERSGAFYHSEVVFCDRNGFQAADQAYLEDLLKGSWWSGYQKIPVDWWEQRHAACTTLSYGGGYNKASCSGISHYSQYLSTRRAGIGNADRSAAYKYIFGTTDFDSSTAKDVVCGGHCGLDWSSDAYNPVSRNCNLFSSTMMSCILDLSQSTPNLGVSDMRRVWKCSSCKLLKRGQIVRVKSEIQSGSRGSKMIPAGAVGQVVALDGAADASVHFGTFGTHWVFSKDFHNLANVWTAGELVVVKTEFKSINSSHALLCPGKSGKVLKLDEEGSALVRFDDTDGNHWVDESDLDKLVKAR